MASTDPTRSPSPSPRSPRRLLTRDQVIAKLREERGMEGLTKTARRYDLAPQQVADVLAGRAKLSRRMYTHLRYRLHEFFERMAE